jgi:hypothetical protein
LSISIEYASSDIPIKNAYNSTYAGDEHLQSDIFVSKFSASKEMIWSTYIGGIYNDEAYSIDIDNNNNCFITGYTQSPNFPLKNAIDSTQGIFQDGFITKFTETYTANTPTNAFSTDGILLFLIGFPILVIILKRKRQ